MGWVLIVLLAAPFGTCVLCLLAPTRVAQGLTLATGLLSFALSLTLVPAATTTALGGWLRIDPLSVVFLVPTAFVYLSTAIFTIGYLHPPGDAAARRRYTRRFYVGINLFAWSMVVAPIVNGLALLWVAIEVTTVVSALLVASDNTHGATEAAWKYVLIASMGLGIALLATIVIYYAGSTSLGSGYDLFYPRLIGSAAHFPKQITKLAFVLAVVGFGTKMGLFPVHTWLPDAHSEAPTPVSGLLSAALLAICFYAILRYYEITERAVGPAFPRDVLLAFGLASLALAAFAVAAQRDLKRLLAYSSVEHMGILAIGMSFAAPLAIVGVLLHVLAHAAGKSTAFFGAGSVVRKFGAKELGAVSGGVAALPWTGPMLVLAVLALSAMPPFGLFRSEFLIVSGGLRDPADAAAAVLVVLVTLAAMGLTWFSGQTMLGPAAVGVARGEPSRWITAAMVLGIAGLVLLGVHPPGDLTGLLQRAAAQLEVRRLTADPTVAAPTGVVVDPSELAAAVEAAVDGGERFAGLIGGPEGDGSFVLRAVLAGPGRLTSLDARLAPGQMGYPALTPRVPPAAWYERELHDRYGTEPVGHPRLDPLILPLFPGHTPPGVAGELHRAITPDSGALDAHASGEGMFTIPYGPVRSGVVETVEYLVETFGEDIPRLRSRVYHKHRAVDVRFEDFSLRDGVLVAERVEGTVAVAHAMAYCQALEQLAGVDVSRRGAGATGPRRARADRQPPGVGDPPHRGRLPGRGPRPHDGPQGAADAVAGQAVRAPFRPGRGRARRGSRPAPRGSVTGPHGGRRRGAGGYGRRPGADGDPVVPRPPPGDRSAAGTARGRPRGARPGGRGSGLDDDTRAARPYGAYLSLGFTPAPSRPDGDALARQRVRLDEIDESFRLVDAALEELAGGAEAEWRVAVEPTDGAVLSAVEAPQGELVYLVEVEDGRPRRVKPRCAAFHNFALFPQAFRGDILTDFVFIEASFGLSIAGVAG